MTPKEAEAFAALEQERDQLRAENERLNKWGEGHHAGFVEQYARANRLEAERDQAKAEIKGLPEKVLDAMGAITNQPITIEQMLDFLRQKHQQRDTWEEQATKRITALAQARAENDQLRAEVERLRSPQWILLMGASSNSGKSIFACTGCGYATPAPIKDHQCNKNPIYAREISARRTP